MCSPWAKPRRGIGGKGGNRINDQEMTPGIGTFLELSA